MSLEDRYLKVIAGQSRGPMARAMRGLLAVAEVPYRWAICARNRGYDRNPGRSASLGRPTISVGNLTAGGTGKTPMVQWVVRHLLEAGERPAILMRGYRKAGSSDSDEQQMLSTSLGVPVEANPDRIAGARAVLQRDPHVSCFVLDDGFQHRRAGRDLDVVLINAAEPFGFGHVHPRGLLREPIEGLCRAGAVVLTHASEISPGELLDLQRGIRRHVSAPLLHADHVNTSIVSADGRKRPIEELESIPFVLFTGIGRPQSLAEAMRQYGGHRGERFFGDHHPYSEAEVRGLVEQAKACGANALITTEKDFTKVRRFWVGGQGVELYRLELAIRFWDDEREMFAHVIASAISSARGGKK